MATTNADFKVKKGLQVEGGDIHLGVDQDGSLSTDNRSGTDLIGRNLSIVAGTGTGNAVGGRIDFFTGGAAGGSTGTAATTSTQVLRMNSDGQSVFYGNLSLSDNNLTSVGTISADNTLGLTIDMSDGNTQTNKILLKDNLADALNITESTNPYMKFRTVNTEERIEIFRDVEFSNARNHVFDVESQSLSNTAGKNLTIGAGEGTGTQDGGQLIFESAGSGGTTGATPTTRATAMTIFPSGTVQIPYVDINDGTIDGALIGSTTADAATFTNVTVEEGGWARINGTARETNSKLQVNGDALSGTSGTTLNYVEARLHTDVSNDDINGTTYNKLGNMFLLDNAEDVPGTGQGVMFTVGRSGVGDHFGVGRVIQGSSGPEYFGIGYAATNFDDSPASNAALLPANLMFELDTSGNASLSKTGATLEFNGNATYTTKIKASASTDTSVTYTLPINAGSSGYVLQTDGSGTLSWTAAAAGADGMGSGFVLEDNAGTEVTIDENKEVKFLDGGGIDATWTDTTPGSDADPYDLTFTLDLNSLTPAVVDVAADSIAIIDANATNATRKESIEDLATAMAGDGLSATSGAFTVNADQSSIITAVGALTGLSTAAAASVDINGADVDITATTLSIDSTDTTNLTMTADNAGDKTLTIDAANTGTGAADIKIGTTSGTAVTIGHTISEVTIGDNLTVNGDLTVSGTTTTISSTVINVDDKNIELGAVDTPSDTTANGGGITLKGTTDHTITWDYDSVTSTNSNWTSSEHWNLDTGKVFKINNTSVLSATTLGSGVTTSSLTTVDALNSGSITSGFGNIDNGTSTISTGQLDVDNIRIDSNTISSTNTNGNITLTPNGAGLVNIAQNDLAIAGTAVTTTAAELNVLDGVTAGTVTASKGLVVDSNKDIGDFGNVTATGTIQGGILSADAVAIVDSSRGSASNLTGITTLATYDVSTYTTAKYVYQIKKDGTVDTDVGEILVTYEGTSNDVYLTEYAMLSTGSSIGAWTADYNAIDTTVRLRFTPTSNGNHTYSIMNTLLIA